MAIVLSNKHSHLDPVGASPQVHEVNTGLWLHLPVMTSAHASAADLELACRPLHQLDRERLAGGTGRHTQFAQSHLDVEHTRARDGRISDGYSLCEG